MMGALSLFHWLFVSALIALCLWPMWRILKRAGCPPALSLLGLFPLGALIGLWVFAFTRWPAEDQASRDSSFNDPA